MLWEIFTLNIVLHCALIWLVKCVRVDTTSRTWTEASTATACTLYGSKNSDEFSASSVDTSSIPDGSTSLYWIGAINTYTSWFEILGCFEVPSSATYFMDQGALRDSKNPIFECCNRCGGTSVNFALSETKCYCVTSNIPTGLNTCSKRSFTYASIDFYGTETDSDSATVPTVHYRKTTGSQPSAGSGTGNCAAVYGTSEPLSHEYLDCNTLLGYLCSENRDNEIVNVYYSTPMTWLNAVLKCVKLAASYTGYYEAAPQDGTRTWTGISRRSKQEWSSGAPIDGTVYSCLAVNKAGEIIPQDCSRQLASLCEGVDGNWGDWSAWGECSETCGTGIKRRTRACDNPRPENGGDPCSRGSSEDSNPCNDGGCPIDGNWGNWSAWGECSETCGTGTKQRTRACDNPPPANGGDSCSSSQSVELKSCNDGECPKTTTTTTTTTTMTTTTTRPTKTSTTNTPTHMTVTHGPATPLTAETSSTLINFSNTSTAVTSYLNNDKTTDGDGVNIALITGAACGGVIFIIMLLALVAVFLKRARAKKSGYKATKNEDLVVTYDVANDQIAQEEKNTQTKDDHIYDGSEENMYDHTNDKRSGTENTNHYGVVDEKKTDNIYDHTNGSDLGNMYESTCRSQNNRILIDNEYGSVMPSKADDVYDTTSRTRKDVVINDNEYGSIGHDTGNDVYDHTVRDNKSDNADRENYDTM